MIQYQFPSALQAKLEAEIVSGDLPAETVVNFDNLKEKFQAGEEDLSIVIHSCIRKGLLRQSSPESSFVVMGKSQPKVISVFQHASQTGMKPKSVVRAVVITPAEAFVARKLMIKTGTPVFKQTRTRIVNEEVIANQNNYIPIEVCPGLESVDLSQTSFQTVLEGRFNAVVDDIRESYKISPANQEDAEILGVVMGKDLLIVQRLSLSPSAFPLVWADIHVRPDRFHYVKDLWPDAAQALKQLKGAL